MLIRTGPDRLYDIMVRTGPDRLDSILIRIGPYRLEVLLLTVGMRPTDFKFSFDLIDEGIDTVVRCHMIND